MPCNRYHDKHKNATLNILANSADRNSESSLFENREEIQSSEKWAEKKGLGKIYSVTEMKLII